MPTINFSKVNWFYSDFQIGELRKYLDTVETLLKKELDEFRQRVDAAAKSIDNPKERDEYYEFHSDDYWRLDESFVRMVRNSFFVMCLSFVEDKLENICDNLKNEHKKKLGWRDIRGDVWDKANLYIETLTGEAPKSIKVWEKIKTHQKLRNCIVHENGKLQDEDLMRYALKEGILPPGEKNLFLTNGYCTQCLADLRTFLKELYDLLDKQKHLAQ